MYQISEKEEKFLKSLAEAFGPPGFEIDPIKIVKEYLRDIADELKHDNLGSLAAFKKGGSEKPTILVAGHSDEVGFMVTEVTKDGYIRFHPLGGWFDQVLLAQRVVIKTKKGFVQGVIASKPPHILKPEERGKVVTIDQMFIDIGATSKKEVEELGVKIGDPIVPWSPFNTSPTGKTFFGKAFDDRIGVFVAAEVLKTLKTKNIEHPNTLVSAATVQEEVGLRGASTIAWLVKPDVAIITEVDIAGDVPGIPPHKAPSKLGKGPTIVSYDSSMIPNQRFREFVIQVAEEAKIPYQLSIVPRGGTDGGRIHLFMEGRPCIVIGVPTRHIHSHVSIVHKDDLENAVKLIIEVIKRLDQETVKSFTSF